MNQFKRKQKISVRCPIPTKEELKRRVNIFAKEDNKTIEQEFDYYIKCRLGDINKSSEEISKEYLRISKIKKCIDVALELMNHGKSKKLKEISNKYYGDMVNYELSQIENICDD